MYSDLGRRLVIRKSVQQFYQLLEDEMLLWKVRIGSAKKKRSPDIILFVCQEIFMTCAAEFSVMLWHKLVFTLASISESQI